MSYDTDEKSVSDAQPAELYVITTPTTTYYLTSHDQDVAYGGNTYTAASIDRDRMVAGQVGQGRALTLSVSLNHALAQDLLVDGVPMSDTTVTISTYMAKSAAVRQWWTGHISDVAATAGGLVKLNVPEKVDDQVSVRLPILQTQRLCPHALYGAGCTLNPTSFQVSTTASAISADGLTITVASIGGHVDQWAQYGKLTRTTDAQPRSVVSQVGTAVVVDVPFRTLVVGDAITINAGCDRSIDTCNTKFSNQVNYGGHPQLPTVNLLSPVRSGLLVSG